MKNKKLISLVLTAMFLATGFVLPFFTGQLQKFGNMLLPMHIPVLLCGFVCGPAYGMAVGLVLPIMRSFFMGMPVMYPMAVAMAFELGTYGFVAGYLYGKSRWKCVWAIYKSLITAMISGRIVWGIAQVILLGVVGNAFTIKAFIAGAFTNSVPGIIIQLVLIPSVMVALGKAKLVPFGKTVNKNLKGDQL